MNDIQRLQILSNSTSEGFDVAKLDTVYNELLLPRFEKYAKNFKSNKIRITDNDFHPEGYKMMKKLFNDKFTVQSLIETEMKSYLIEKGYKVHIWSPKYSVEVSW